MHCNDQGINKLKRCCEAKVATIQPYNVTSAALERRNKYTLNVAKPIKTEQKMKTKTLFVLISCQKSKRLLKSQLETQSP